MVFCPLMLNCLLIVELQRSSVDMASQTPRGFCVSPEKYAEVRRKLKSASVASDRLRQRVKKLEEHHTDNGESGFTSQILKQIYSLLKFTS